MIKFSWTWVTLSQFQISAQKHWYVFIFVWYRSEIHHLPYIFYIYYIIIYILFSPVCRWLTWWSSVLSFSTSNLEITSTSTSLWSLNTSGIRLLSAALQSSQVQLPCLRCMYVCMCVYMYVCMYICMFVCYRFSSNTMELRPDWLSHGEVKFFSSCVELHL